jgi:hypothetical protein
MLERHEVQPVAAGFAEWYHRPAPTRPGTALLKDLSQLEDRPLA